MIRQCVEADPNIGDGDARCGLTFDDVDHDTICPHAYIPTREERERMIDELAAFHTLGHPSPVVEYDPDHCPFCAIHPEWAP